MGSNDWQLERFRPEDRDAAILLRKQFKKTAGQFGHVIAFDEHLAEMFLAHRLFTEEWKEALEEADNVLRMPNFRKTGPSGGTPPYQMNLLFMAAMLCAMLEKLAFRGQCSKDVVYNSHRIQDINNYLGFKMIQGLNTERGCFEYINSVLQKIGINGAELQEWEVGHGE